MSTKSVKPIPEGMHTVTPHLICGGAADAIEFYKKAFNAVETSRMPGPGGKLGPKALKGSSVFIHLYVDDVDAFSARAAAAGAKITMPVADMFWGDRYGQLEDPFGHRWSIATHVRDMTPAEMQEAMRNTNSRST
jgi:PhnB protein